MEHRSFKQQKISDNANNHVPPVAGNEHHLSTNNNGALPSKDQVIIGLDLGGRVFYTLLSTLTTARGFGGEPNYFSSSLIGAAAMQTTDDFGRHVYFLDRADDLFHYILQFLREGIQTWPSFASDPVLWNRLRAEAQYYKLADLADALVVTHSCSPGKDNDRGVASILAWN